MKVAAKPARRRLLPQCPCPKHGAFCDVVGMAANRFITFRCGIWEHSDAATARVAALKSVK